MNILRKSTLITWLGVASLFLSGCEDLINANKSEPKIINVNGSVEKGPFAVGSNVSITELSSNGLVTNTVSMVDITNDLGHFEFSYAEGTLLKITASGYYRNEITGELSNGILNLSSIIKTTNNANQKSQINILTHLISARVLKLIEAGNSYETASSAATSELLTSLDNVVNSPIIESFSTLSLYESEVNSEGDAYLVTISTLLYQHAMDLAEQKNTNSNTELTLVLYTLSTDISDGILDDITIINSLKTIIPKVNAQSVQTHLTDISSLSGKSLVPANIDYILDSDFDGIINEHDLDDDNDQIPDTEDNQPYQPNFLVNDLVLKTSEDTDLLIALDFNNPMGSDVNYIASTAPSHGILMGSFPNIIYRPNTNFNGADTVTLYLSQEGLISEQFVITLNVHSDNDLPIISGTSATSIKAYTDYLFTPVASDADNNILEFSISNKPDWLSFSTVTGQLSGTPDNDDAATYSNIIVTVSDGINEVSLPAFNLAVDVSAWTPYSILQEGTTGKAVRVGDDVYFVAGGSQSVFKYYPASDTWETKAIMPVACFSEAELHLDDLIYVICNLGTGFAGGNIMQIYNIANDSWSTGTPMLNRRSSFTASVANGKIYVVGGMEGSYYINILPDTEAFDPTTGLWTSKSKAPLICKNSSASTIDDKIYLVGGEYPCEIKLHIYDPKTDLWSEGTDMKQGSFGHLSEVIDDELYVIGSSYTAINSTLWLFDPVTQQWQEKDGTLTGKSTYRSSSVVLDDSIYVFGGWNGSDLIEKYDPALD
jgi:hypothetical protein